MSKRGDLEFLGDIEEAIRRIDSYAGQMEQKLFFEDKKTQDAVVRNLEIIGEATKNMSEKLKSKHPNVPWKDMARLRDRLIHHYHGVNYEIVWGIIKEELPKLLPQIKKVINREFEGQVD